MFSRPGIDDLKIATLKNCYNVNVIFILIKDNQDIKDIKNSQIYE